MPIVNHLTYEPPVRSLVADGLVKTCKRVSEVFTDFAISMYEHGDGKLRNNKQILEDIDSSSGVIKFSLQSNPHLLIEIDTSQIKAMFQKYRELSETPGCKSCKSYYCHSYLPGEHYFFCKLHEKPGDEIKLEGNSPNIEKYLKTGCEDRIPIVPAALEKILEMIETEPMPKSP